MTSTNVHIIDYNVGNIASIANMLKKLNVKPEISRLEKDLLKADKLILPGVGAWDRAMRSLDELSLIEPIKYFANTLQRPVLGICLGMQLLLNNSEEGEREGLGLIQGQCVSLKKLITANQKIRVPHMGWNELLIERPSPLLKTLPEPSRFYFVHSYACLTENKSMTIASTDYHQKIPAVISRENIFGAQFHPEKSHKYGKQFLKNFCEL